MEDFSTVLEQMKAHGMKVPSSRVELKIKDSKTILENCFRYFLSFENANFVCQPEYNKVAEWLSDNEGRGLLLYGDCGRGKTMLSRYILPAILLEYCNKVVSVYDVQEMNKRLDEVLNKHIVSLDDVGTEEISVSYGNKRDAFSEIMDAAEKFGKLIIISTNLSGKELEAQYGKRVLERIISTTKRIEFKGDSLRK
jgi:DNA replication protein DnaC